MHHGMRLRRRLCVLPFRMNLLFDVRMRSSVVLLGLFPLCFAAPHFHRSDEDVNRELLVGRSCMQECQANIHLQFNLSTNSRPRDYQEYCEFTEKLIECFEKCPYNPASPLTKHDAEINARICGRNFSSEKFEGSSEPSQQ